jgi:hypothetical protein
MSNHLLRIDSVWMAVSVDDDGTEGVCAILVGEQWMPLLAADEARVPFIIDEAEKIAKAQQRVVKVIRLSNRSKFATFDGRQ